MTFDSSKLKLIIIAVLALFAALYLGIIAATAQLETIAWVLGGVTLVACILLGRRIWLLIPLLGSLNLTLMIPGQPTTSLLAQGLVLGFATVLFLMRKLPFRLQFTELEFWILIISLLVFQVYIRNPVSINLLGGETVGGRGYIIYAISLFIALLVSGLRVSAGELKWIIPLSIIGGLLNLAISILGIFIPILGYYTGTRGMTIADSGYSDQIIDPKAAGRVSFLAGFSNNLSLWVSSHISPLRACFRPWWAILVITAVLAAGLSGFRNSIAAVGMTLLIGIAYRSGFVGVIISIIGGILGLTLLAAVNTVQPLPPNIQRSLTFLPGTWEERYKLDAAGSTEWRIDIWREVLFTDRWIENKWLGDGLGFSAAELTAQVNLREGARAGLSGFDAHRENILSNGDYHSGPVSTIRVVGYVGLLLFLLAQIRLAVHAHRQIIRCRGTPWLPLALFTGIPLVWGPIFFVFIFGDFKSGASAFLLSLSMMRLLENNLPLPAWSRAKRTPYLLNYRHPQPSSTLPRTTDISQSHRGHG
jgi:hypothetical protein